MHRILIFFFMIFLLASVCNQADAQSLIQTAKKAEQRAKELKQQENSRYHSILDSRDLSKYEQFIKDYPNSQNTREIKGRAEEIHLYNNAKKRNTVLAYENYLHNSKYHWFNNEANVAIRDIKKVSEKQAWEKVVAENTIEAYQQYLTENPTTGYKIEAENAIKNLREAEVWDRIKNSNNIYELENFVKSYPNSTKINIITARLHELNGVRYYNNHNLEGAYAEFSKLNKNQISPDNRIIFEKVMEYHDFHNLGNYASEGDLLSFIRKYPNGNFYTQACNKLAIIKAQNFSYYTSESDYEDALNYANDEITKKTVRGCIARSKNLKKERAKAIRNAERNLNGGLFNLGFDFMDIGFNGENDLWYYDLGLMLRIGNFKDRIQFALGVKSGWLGYSELNYDYYNFIDYSYEYTENKIKFHMPFIGQLKINLFNLSENSRFFIYGKYQYNAIRIKQIEREMSWGIGCGFAWKHFDWSFYYKKDFGRIDNTVFKIPYYWGMSLIYYCQL